MEVIITAQSVVGMEPEEKERFINLLNSYNTHITKNREKNRYYEGKISLGEVNLGIALPLGMQGLEIGCSWGAKTVDVLAARSMFDGFVGINGEDVATLDKITSENNLVAEYMKACRDELKYGCTFAECRI